MSIRRRTCLALPFTLSPLLAGCPEGEREEVVVTPQPVQTAIRPIAGLDFSPYQGAQNPNLDPRVTREQISARLGLIKRHVRRIRTFGCADGLEFAPALARSVGLKVAAGAWISAKLNENERQLANLIEVGRAGDADLLVVGSETLLRGELSEAALMAYIGRVRTALPAVRVSYADTWSTLLDHPALIAAVDVVMVNYYPYWEGIAIENALLAISDWHARIRTAAGAKPVAVSEAGWPSAGNAVGNAVPSEENAAAFFSAFVSWAELTGVDEYYFFEATDEAWKASVEGPQGAHWGLFTADGQLKPGRDAVFEGKRIADNWSARVIPGGAGQAVLEFASVPPIGSNDDLRGRALHVLPAAYNVAVYIFVAGGWWVKPTAAKPLTRIAFDGSWVADITTGGIDSSVTEIAAFLLPRGTAAPALLGASILPDALLRGAGAVQRVQRL